MLPATWEPLSQSSIYPMQTKMNYVFESYDYFSPVLEKISVTVKVMQIRALSEILQIQVMIY